MDVKYQVFVSSTFEDLKDERRVVIEAILNLGHIPVGMEVFQASDEAQWAYIRNRIDESDYYVVILAERYGSEQDGKSYTQMEYEYAAQRGVPTMAFLLDSDARKQWPQNKVEFDKRDKVEGFRKLCQQKLVRFWRSADDLSGKVAMTLMEQMRLKPRTGWVRGDSVPSSAVLNEIAALSEEKRRLQEQVEKLSASTELAIPNDVLRRIERLQMVEASSVVEDFQFEEEVPSLFDMFLILDRILDRGAEAWEIYERLAGHFRGITEDAVAIDRLCFAFVEEKVVEVSRIQVNGRSTRQYKLSKYGKDFAVYATHYRNLALDSSAS